MTPTQQHYTLPAVSSTQLVTALLPRSTIVLHTTTTVLLPTSTVVVQDLPHYRTIHQQRSQLIQHHQWVHAVCTLEQGVKPHDGPQTTQTHGGDGQLPGRLAVVIGGDLWQFTEDGDEHVDRFQKGQTPQPPSFPQHTRSVHHGGRGQRRQGGVHVQDL